MSVTTHSGILRLLWSGLVATIVFAACVAEPGAAPQASAVPSPSVPSAPSAQPMPVTPVGLADRLCSTAGASQALALGASTGVPIAAFPATAAAVVAWQESRDGPGGPLVSASYWRMQPQVEFVAICYYDGDFAGVSRPPSAPAYERAILLVTEDGTVTIDRFGPRNALPATGPTS